MNYTQHITKNRKEAAREYVSLVQHFIKKKYAHEKRIDCRFDIYYHEADNLRKVKRHKIVLPLPRIAYTQLMVVLLTYPDLTFQDLPVYIPRGLYDGLLCALYFPRYSHVYNLSVHPSHYGPIAVEMTTLQKDAREIAGEDMYTFLLPPLINDSLQDVSVHCECRKVEFKVMRFEYDKERLAVYSFGSVDSAQLEKILGVSDFRGIKEALLKIHNTLPREEQSDVFWPIYWLNKNNIRHMRREEFSN